VYETHSASIEVTDPREADVRQLLERHLTFAGHHSPPEHVHALHVDALVDPAITFVAYRDEGDLLGVGALKDLGGGHGELKSMHTAAPARGRGIGRAIVEHLVALAREQGMTRVSLETGTPDAFAPARSLYASAGFVPCAPFGGYQPSTYSTCLTLDLTDQPENISAASDPP
jgi:putative acetyltransferase